MPATNLIPRTEIVQHETAKRVDLKRFATPHIIDRFWALIHKTDDCWIWIGSTRKGYGKFHPVPGVTISAPRFAYFLTYGVDPGGAYTCHVCDRRICSRPQHLFLGTPQANIDDMMGKGRFLAGNHQGERNARAKLTAQDVETIKARCAAGETNTAIAKDYGVTHHAISRIRLGKAWTGPRGRPDINRAIL